jgi:hypothetical protein
VSFNNRNFIFVDHFASVIEDTILKRGERRQIEEYKQGSLDMSLPEESESPSAFF